MSVRKLFESVYKTLLSRLRTLENGYKTLGRRLRTLFRPYFFYFWQYFLPTFVLGFGLLPTFFWVLCKFYGGVKVFYFTKKCIFGQKSGHLPTFAHFYFRIWPAVLPITTLFFASLPTYPLIFLINAR